MSHENDSNKFVEIFGNDPFVPGDDYSYEYSYSDIEENQNQMPIPAVSNSSLHTHHHQRTDLSSEIEYGESEDNPGVFMTTLSNSKIAIAAKLGFHGEPISVSQFVKYHPGLVILPLSALSMIRKPSGSHKKDPKLIIYLPEVAATGGQFDTCIASLCE